MSSAANHRKRSHRSESRNGNRRRTTFTVQPRADLRPTFFGLANILRNRMSVKRLAVNNAARARLDAPAPDAGA
jgi:hypothetical protein